jgi:hypothetical protein
MQTSRVSVPIDVLGFWKKGVGRRTPRRSQTAGFLILAAMLGTYTLGAAPITLTFDITVSSRYLYSQGQYDATFSPTDVLITSTFDTSASATAQYPTDTQIYFGLPQVNSPMTAMLPYGPGATTINPPNSGRDTLMDNYNNSSGSGSYFQVQQYQYDEYGPNSMQFWSYDFDLYLAYNPHNPPLSNPLNFAGPDLIAWLETLKGTPSQVYYFEETRQFDRTTGTYLGGIGYDGLGVLTSVSTPEPQSSTFVLTGCMLLLVMACVSRCPSGSAGGWTSKRSRSSPSASSVARSSFRRIGA